NSPPIPAKTLADTDRLSTSALNDRLPSLIATLVCLTRLKSPASTTNPNASSAISPSTMANSTVSSISSVTVPSSSPATCVQSSRSSPAGPLLTCTVPDTVNPSPSMPTNPASVTLTCSPVYLLAGSARSLTSTKSS